jgi:hypothetical protein
MFNLKKLAEKLLRLCVDRGPTRPIRRRSLRVEALEERWCPAGTWEWVGWGAADGGDGLWSNPTGKNWLLNGALAAGGKVANDDVVKLDLAAFGGKFTGPATLNVALPQPLNTLDIDGWADTLTLDNKLSVKDGLIGSGYFNLGDNSTIFLAANIALLLQDLPGPNTWSNGTIAGAAGSQVTVAGSQLSITGTPVSLQPDLLIQGTAAGGGRVVLDGMTTNLALNGRTNSIKVGANASLDLFQQIAVNGSQNLRGGIAFGPAHLNPDAAVQVQDGGTLNRGGAPVVGVPDQVVVEGAIYNTGGLVHVFQGAMLNVTGTDDLGEGISYWQDTSANAVLAVDVGSNIRAVGTYEIDTGTVQLQALSGQNMTIDALDGQGLNFGNISPTFLTVTDSTIGAPGWVGVGGPVTLAANTTLTMHFSGASNTPDVLYVQNGALNLGGTLNLLSVDQPLQKPTASLDFLGDSGGAASIGGAFASFTGNVPGATYTGGLDPLHPGFYQVTIQ